MRRSWRELRVVAFLAAAVLVVGVAVAGACGVFRGVPEHAPDPLVDEPAPAVSGTTLGGRRVELSSWSRGVTVVNIWASWCGPCRAELPEIAAFARRADDGVDVLTIDTRDGPAAARSLLAEVGASDLPVVQDPQGRLAVAWGATGVPETFVVDASGTVRARSRGAVTQGWLEDQVRRWAPR